MSSGRSTRDQRQAKAAHLRAEAARAQARRRQAVVGAAVLALVAIVVGVFVVVQNARREEATASTATPANLGPGDSVVVGRASAPVTLSTYEDFLCPACNAFEQANASRIDEWVRAGTVKVEYHPVAILDRMSSDGYSTRSMNAAAAVVDSAPAAFPAFHRALFANQPEEGGAGLSDDRLIELAVTAGAPRDAVTRAVREETFRAWTVRATEAASRAGLSGTPWVKVNGTVVEDPTAAALEAAVSAAAGAS